MRNSLLESFSWRACDAIRLSLLADALPGYGPSSTSHCHLPFFTF
jgi:hypothetical protein